MLFTPGNTSYGFMLLRCEDHKNTTITTGENLKDEHKKKKGKTNIENLILIGVLRKGSKRKTGRRRTKPDFLFLAQRPSTRKIRTLPHVGSFILQKSRTEFFGTINKLLNFYDDRKVEGMLKNTFLGGIAFKVFPFQQHT